MDLLVKMQSERIKELEAELGCWLVQYGCACDHPKCTRCKDSDDARALLDKPKITTVNLNIGG
jgi:hypothetical protein